MEEKIETLFKDISTKRGRPAPRKPVPEIDAPRISFDSLEDKKIVVTGKLFQMGRDKFSLWLKERGAKMQSSVSSHTDLLVVGKRPGGVKVTKAKESDVPICYETEFFDKFGSQLTLNF